MSGSLFVCALPIGNDLDVSIRVKDCLESIKYIACEDTRVIRLLLKRLNILSDQTLFRMDQFQEKRSFNQFDEYIVSNDVAFVSDAGTPGISDPGSLLVDYCYSKHINIEILAGPSAITTFIAGAGKLLSNFYFGGFLPRKKTELNDVITHFIKERQVSIWFESPKRILATIDSIRLLSPMIEIICAKELTKTHEQYFRGTAETVYDLLNSADLRGEWILMIDGGSIPFDDSIDIRNLAIELSSSGLSGKQVKSLAPLFKVSKNKLFEEFNQL